MAHRGVVIWNYSLLNARGMDLFFNGWNRWARGVCWRGLLAGFVEVGGRGWILSARNELCSVVGPLVGWLVPVSVRIDPAVELTS